MKNRKRKAAAVSIVVLLVVIGCLSRPATHLINVASHDVDELVDPAEGFVDDASRLDLTKVDRVWSVPAGAKDQEERLAAILAEARAKNLHVSISGARHSMGGHTIYPGGVAIDMLPMKAMHYDAAREIVTVQAGALWRDVIAHLDPLGRSVAVMQSDHSFSVGGSLSVNCHGWQFDRPPIASTVESFRLMQADGTIVRCSRTENAELFSLALGGYGLFGIILDAELHTVPNERYRLHQYLVPADQSLATLDGKIKAQPGVQMVYARTCIVPSRLCDEVIINAFAHEEGTVPALAAPGMAGLRRTIFRGSADSDYGKELRWSAETKLQPKLSGTIFSRNQLLSQGVEEYQNRTASTTDILHEYFIPQAHAAEFVIAMRRIIPAHKANLLNITVRSVNEDKDTFLRYATEPMLAFVTLFVQDKSDPADAAMETMTGELIDAALASGGRYYLPYRLHGSPDQFRAAYPQGDKFFELKRRYDPGELFQNRFYLKYGKVASSSTAGTISP